MESPLGAGDMWCLQRAGRVREQHTKQAEAEFEHAH